MEKFVIWPEKPGSNIIPFGKYRGRRMNEVISADPDYVRWMVQQPGLVEKYPQLFSSTSTAERSDATPDHNRLQALFLDAGFRRLFVAEALAGGEILAVGGPSFETITDVSFGFRVRIDDDEYDWRLMVEIKPVLGDDFPVVLRQIKNQRERLDGLRKMYKWPFDDDGYHGVGCAWALMTESHHYAGVTHDQVIGIFDTECIAIIELES